MAKEMLKDIIYAIRFSDTILTEPIGMPEGTPSYVNAVAAGMTSLSIDELRNEIKRIERLIERNEYDTHRGKIHIDIDIMQAICDRLGMELKVEDMAFDSIISAVYVKLIFDILLLLNFSGVVHFLDFFQRLSHDSFNHCAAVAVFNFFYSLG